MRSSLLTPFTPVADKNPGRRSFTPSSSLMRAAGFATAVFSMLILSATHAGAQVVGGSVYASPSPYQVGDSIYFEVDGSWPEVYDDCYNYEDYCTPDYAYVRIDGDDEFSDETYTQEWEDWTDYTSDYWNFQDDYASGGTVTYDTVITIYYYEWFAGFDLEAPPKEIITYVPEAVPTISGDDTIWWLAGASMSGYPLTQTLTSSGGSSTTWTIVAGSSKVSLSSSSGTTTIVSSTGSAWSTSVGDIKITAAVGGSTSTQFSMTSLYPHHLISDYRSDVCPDSSHGYTTHIGYHAYDQLTNRLPGSFSVNEYWTGAWTDDNTNNWLSNGRSNDGPYGFTGDGFADLIEAWSASDLTPQVDCGNDYAIHHVVQEWRVGSEAIDQGVCVQRDHLGRRRGYGVHEPSELCW